jgi:hypothetical protein
MDVPYLFMDCAWVADSGGRTENVISIIISRGESDDRCSKMHSCELASPSLRICRKCLTNRYALRFPILEMNNEFVSITYNFLYGTAYVFAPS